MQRVFVLVKKEFRQIFRDPMMPRIIFLMPLIQLLILGFAATTDVRNIDVSVLDMDRSSASRALVDAHYATDLFRPGPAAHDPGDLQQFLARGRADMTLWIPADFERRLVERKPATVGVVLDGRNSSQAGRAAGYVAAIFQRESRTLLEQEGLAPAAAAPVPQVQKITRFFYNPQLESRYYMVPGIVAMLVTVISLLLTGMAVVREKEIGTLEQLMVTPITSLELVAGKTLPFVVITFVELAVGTLLAMLIYDLVLVGSFLVLAFASLIYLLVTLGGGLLASTVSKTQQQAMFTVWFFMVFFILTSGFFYPVDNMPDVVRWSTYINPMRYYMSIIRAVFLKGAGLADLGGQLLPLAILGVVAFSGAVLRFQKRLS